jgi:hypothetical protein
MHCDVADFVDDDTMRDVNPNTVLLIAFLSDQIQSLGRYYRAGMWRKDPSELGEWLRQDHQRVIDTKGRHNVSLRDEVIHEWRLWGTGTDVLIEVLCRDTIVRIDRGRIIALAKAAGSPSIERASIRARRREKARYMRDYRSGAIEVCRRNRVA